MQRCRFVEQDGAEFGLNISAIAAFNHFPAYEDKDGDCVSPRLVVHVGDQVLTFRGDTAVYFTNAIRGFWAQN